MWALLIVTAFVIGYVWGAYRHRTPAPTGDDQLARVMRQIYGGPYRQPDTTVPVRPTSTRPGPVR